MILPWRRDLIKSTNAGAAGSFHPMCLKNVVKFTRQIEQDTEDASFDLRFTFFFFKKKHGAEGYAGYESNAANYYYVMPCIF